MKSIYPRAAAILFPLSAAALLAASAHAAPPFGVDTPQPSQTFVNQETTFYSELDDPSSMIQRCELLVDGSSHGAMTMIVGPGGKSAFLQTSIATAGSRTVRVSCFSAGDADNVWADATVTVFADSSAPAVGPFTLTPDSPVAGSSVNIQSNYDDTDFGSGIDNCSLYVNGTFISLMNLSGGSGSTAGSASRNHTFSSGGSYNVKVECTDRSGNIGGRSETVSVASAPDTTPPTVGAVSPTNVTAGASFTFSATYSDTGSGVTQCELYEGATLLWSSAPFGPNVSGTASVGYSYPSAGTHDVRMRCRDASGNWGNGPVTTITVTAAASTPYAYQLVKLVCPAGFIDVNHPCKAVYYVGSDGKRHAFPNERVFFTWYSNFDGVIELTGPQLSTIPLGSNVNYRPGLRMVKFTTVNKVYAVGRYGQLRWVTSEAIATSLYGSNWNTRIDDINDAFFTDYTFGPDINTVSDFNPIIEAASITNIDANLR